MWRPRFRSDYVPVRLPDGPLVVLGETRSLLVDDPVAADLADQLDGAAPLADVLARLPPAIRSPPSRQPSPGCATTACWCPVPRTPRRPRPPAGTPGVLRPRPGGGGWPEGR